MRELAERFISDYVDVHLKACSAVNYKDHLEAVILPGFGDRDVRNVKKAEVAALHPRLVNGSGSPVPPPRSYARRAPQCKGRAFLP